MTREKLIEIMQACRFTAYDGNEEPYEDFDESQAADDILKALEAESKNGT